MKKFPDNISAYIFDLDGVIFDSERAVYNEWKLISKKHGFTNLDEPYMKCIGVNAKTSKRIFLEYYGRDFPYDEYEKEMRQNYHNKYDLGKLPIKTGVIELLKSIKKKGTHIAIASSTQTEIVQGELRDAELLNYFDVIIGGDMVERSKPAPDIFLKAAAILGVVANACCVIEDSYNGIRAASSAGMFSIMIPDMLLPNDEMRNKANLILQSATELLNLVK